MAQFRNTSYTEFAPANPNEKFGVGNSSMTRQFDIRNGSFQGRCQAAYDFIGYAVVLPAGVSGPPFYVHRVTPMPYGGLAPAAFLPPLAGDTAPVPDMQNRFWVAGISRTEPLGAPKGVNLVATPAGTAAANYARARLTVELTTLPYLIKPDSDVIATSGPLIGFPDEGQALASGWINTRYIHRHRDPFSRLLKVPLGIAYVGGKQLPQGFPKREGGSTFTYTQMRIPLSGPASGFNDSGVGSQLGTVNDATFDGNPAGTMLFDNYHTREYQGAFGEPLLDFTAIMVYMPNPSTGANVGTGGPAAGTQLGLNYIWTVINGKQDYYLATTDADGTQPMYQSSDFAALFRPRSV